ncbi:FAD/NAD(P)-binding domain-containing protein [Gymnopus androsaceus JB14]|uniref:FAD/NAD(P)-binding domain-containing protein n=1 Tax=Gymnopus androsaceus JB14 TaxID=1447944 RepID=A0A6A4HJV7_9AGAR|nr:FAD/NAD(P)-binding domain-containing protein [Gymnopus androsaceus JB14]
MSCFFAFILSTFSATAYSKIYSVVSELPEDVNYDFIIVGGGTAGCVLANRLSANPRVNVLVIEAGSTPDSALNVEVPFFAPFLKGTTFDWNFTSVAQPSLNNRTVYYERGHTLGGSSVVNLLAFNRGSNDFWDRWATLTNDSQWSWENIEPYYMRTSQLADPHSGLIPSAHGDGPVLVSTPGFETILNEPVIDTAKSIGGRFSFQTDWNAGNFTALVSGPTLCVFKNQSLILYKVDR